MRRNKIVPNGLTESLKKCIFNVYTWRFSMVTKIQKWGNSLGLRIPISFAKEAAIEEGSSVDISLEGDCNWRCCWTRGMVMAPSYIPERGDIVWLEFNPQAGHEQSGRRPALVISPKLYNQKVGLAIFCPITSRVKGYPFEVILPDAYKVSGAILSDQVKSLDWQARKAQRIAPAPKDVVEEVLAKILTILGLESR